jgi:hypothetical protein
MKADEFVERKLDECAKDIKKNLDSSDVLTIYGDLVGGVDNLIREIVEEKLQKFSNNKKLTVILKTLGGYIEIVQRIVETIRHHYDVVDFLVADYAYSAGTVFVMSGDAIHMDYFSRLGPIDPQVQNDSGRQVPALGYLIQWERLLKKAQNSNITLPEVQLMVEKFDQAELYQYEQARELSISLLEEWLVKYKFKNWKVTQSRGIEVTTKMKKERAHEIAMKLNDTDKWHTHGYGISMDVLGKELNLIIDDFEKNPKMCKCVKEYSSLLDDYMQKMGHETIVHVIGLYKQFNG